MRRVEGAQAAPRRKKVERREQKIEQRRRLEEMRSNEEEVEMAITDAPPRRGQAPATQIAAAMAGADEPDTTIDEAAAEPIPTATDTDENA